METLCLLYVLTACQAPAEIVESYPAKPMVRNDSTFQSLLPPPDPQLQKQIDYLQSQED